MLKMYNKEKLKGSVIHMLCEYYMYQHVYLARTKANCYASAMLAL